MDAIIIVDIVRNIIVYWALHLFFSGYLKQRDSYSVLLVLLGAIIYVSFFIMIGISDIFYLNAIRMLAGCFLIAALYYKDKLLKLVVFTILFHFIGIMADFSVGATITALAFTYIADVVYSPNVQVVGGLIASVVVFVFVYIFRKIFKDKHSYDSTKDLLFMSSFLILSSIITVAMFSLLSVATIPIVEYIILLFALPALLFSSILIFFQYNNAVKRKELEMELAVRKEMEHTHITLAKQHETNIEEKNALIHDFKNNIIHLSGIIIEPPVAITYCNELIESCSSQLASYKFSVNNEILSAILGKLKYDCEQCDVELNLKLLHQDFSFVKPLDTSSLFGNVFENAVTACKGMSKNRWMKVVLSNKGNFVCIAVSNSKNNEIVVNDNHFLSTHRQYTKKGYGIKTIKSIASQYGGNACIEYTESDFTCIIWLDSTK